LIGDGVVHDAFVLSARFKTMLMDKERERLIDDHLRTTRAGALFSTGMSSTWVGSTNPGYAAQSCAPPARSRPFSG